MLHVVHALFSFRSNLVYCLEHQFGGDSDGGSGQHEAMECEIGSRCTEDDPGKARQTQGDHCVVCGHPQVYDLSVIYTQMYMKTNESKSSRKIPHTSFFPVILCYCVLSVNETVQMIRLIMCK